ncbi:MAG: HlyC/CorC family transporter [Oscillospiraceae bacterium]|nr:HlyC/CorC family transporter [Oscillospiraceae bacterium]MBR4093539.1 HlyC/CorC family transporter [Oscillospiraceae bacterium]
MISDSSRLSVVFTETDISGWGIAVIVVIVLLRAFFTLCEFAVTEINDSVVKDFEDEKGGKKILSSVLSKPSAMITTFSANRILSAVVISLCSFAVFFSPLYKCIIKLFEENIFADEFSTIISAVIIVLSTVVVMTVFSDRIPKRIAMAADSVSLAVFVALPVRILIILLTPLTALCGLLTKLFSFLFGLSQTDERDIATEEEILMLVDARNETGELEESQKEMISNIFEFDDTLAGDVMTHRTDIDAVDIKAKVPDVIRLAIDSGRSRIPVYENTIDSILGFVCVKDLLCLIGCENVEGFEITNFIRDVLYVPGTNSCGEVFEMMRKNKAQLAVVVDEYGGTAGLITMEDILESIVGNIQDEYDNDAEEIIEVSEGTYMISGTSDPEKILSVLGKNLPEEHEYDTMGGFITDLLGRIPEENENASVVYEDIEFTVLITEEKRITKIKAVVLNDKTQNKE